MSDLTLPSRAWDVDKVRASCLPMEADAILAIPLGQSSAVDSMCWDFDPKGVYSVKSGCKLAHSLSRSESSSSDE